MFQYVLGSVVSLGEVVQVLQRFVDRVPEDLRGLWLARLDLDTRAADTPHFGPLDAKQALEQQKSGPTNTLVLGEMAWVKFYSGVQLIADETAEQEGETSRARRITSAFH